MAILICGVSCTGKTVMAQNNERNIYFIIGGEI